MDTHTADQLRVLRERADGPDADLHRDAAAVRRLRQLEGQGRPEAREAAEHPETTSACR